MVIGSVFAWVLGLGVLFLSIFTTERATGNSSAGTSVLFGSVLGLDANQTLVAVGVGLAVTVAVLVIARPLLFASLDATAAAARGVPVTLLGYGFLALVGATAAEATQAVGALLLLGLLAAPAAIAQRLTARPYRAMALSVAVAVAAIWIGLTISYAAGDMPPSFAILSVTTGGYVAVGWWDRRRSRGARREASHLEAACELDRRFDRRGGFLSVSLSILLLDPAFREPRSHVTSTQSADPRAVRAPAMMGTVRREVRIARSADDVWAVVGDPASMAEWFPGVDRLHGRRATSG